MQTLMTPEWLRLVLKQSVLPETELAEKPPVPPIHAHLMYVLHNASQTSGTPPRMGEPRRESEREREAGNEE